MRVSKTVAYVGRAAAAAVAASGVAVALAPAVALADGWASDITGNAAERTGDSGGKTVTASDINDRVQSITAWLLGLAIGIFVLKVVLTGIDRILLDKDTNGAKDSPLVNLPIIGAYPQPSEKPGGERGYTWQRIWTNLFLQVAITVAAWLIVGFIIGLISNMLAVSGLG